VVGAVDDRLTGSQERFHWAAMKYLRFRDYSFELGGRTLVMGILNLTPDSFSGDGIYHDSGRAVRRAMEMREEGADLIDVGGESTRPGSTPVGADVELKRIAPVVKRLVALGIPVSVDTYKPKVAERVLDMGAHAINDITGLRDRKMAIAVAERSAGVVIMHMKGRPMTMQKDRVYPDGVVATVLRFLRSQSRVAHEAGIKDESVVVDPGIGFGKTAEQNSEIIRGLASLKTLRRPILVGPSRKSFLERSANAPLNQRLDGTIAVVVASVMNGADMVRVHNVAECKRAVAVADAIARARRA
jgi:dihydropteroate synthase